MLKINELNSYLKSKGVPEDSYSINEVNDESLCIIEENKKWHIFYSERGLRTEEYCCQDEHLAILYFINRLSKMLKFSFEWKKANCSLYETFSPDVECVRCARDFYFSYDLYPLTQTIRLGGNYEEINGVGI